jgi:FdhE protein
MVAYASILEVLRRRTGTPLTSPDVIALHCRALEAQAQATFQPHPRLPGKAEAAGRLSFGRPALDLASLALDRAAFLNLCEQFASITAAHRPDLASELAALTGWLRGKKPGQPPPGGFTVAELLDVWPREAAAAGLPGDLLGFLVSNALRPFMRAQAEALSGQLDKDAWQRGCCPVCGAEPDFAALEKEAGGRRLLCSRCDTEWPFARVTCPFCGDETQAAYYRSADSVYRLYVCGACQRYLKTLDLREVADERVLPAERILTAGMDVAVREAAQASVASGD